MARKKRDNQPISQNQTKKQILLQAPKGMRDILPEDFFYWEKIRKALKSVADFYDFKFIDTPILERVEIFSRGIGLSTDIVEKEMYLIKSRGKERLALRPELTAPIIRAYFEHGMSRWSQPVKLYYLGPFFRYENPQAGRFRQFHQAGFEIIGGASDPAYDAMSILAGLRFLEELKIAEPMIEINSIGCRICRSPFEKRLIDYYRKQISLAKNKKVVCRDCERRLQINPLRLLDCKSELCQVIKNEAPTLLDHLCASCRSHFKYVLEILEEIGIVYRVNSCLVRGFDYYNRTVFELFSKDGGLALGGGGRYDYLGELLGEKSVPAVGVAPGIERIIQCLKEGRQLVVEQKKPRIFLAYIGDLAKRKAIALMESFREANIRVAEAFSKDSLHAQLKTAHKEESTFALIIGQKEVYEESVIVRDMSSGVQETVPIKKIIDVMKKKIQ